MALIEENLLMDLLTTSIFTESASFTRIRSIECVMIPIYESTPLLCSVMLNVKGAIGLQSITYRSNTTKAECTREMALIEENLLMDLLTTSIFTESASFTRISSVECVMSKMKLMSTCSLIALQ
ncbi:hypothetical protein J6590_036836 [Homalodisca vitripennis]|nr:hypothetical protein J6590_036836 [Homalodisca vitripennis]